MGAGVRPQMNIRNTTASILWSIILGGSTGDAAVRFSTNNNNCYGSSLLYSQDHMDMVQAATARERVRAALASGKRAEGLGNLNNNAEDGSFGLHRRELMRNSNNRCRG